jgi:hypothetical protein
VPLGTRERDPQEIAFALDSEIRHRGRA